MRRTTISFRIDPDALKSVDEARGLITRSTVLNAIIKKGIADNPRMFATPACMDIHKEEYL